MRTASAIAINMKILQRNSGVTLIELVFVVTLISILAGSLISVVNVQRQQQTAEEANLRTNLLKVCSALITYYEAENQTYPGECVIAGCPVNKNPLDPSAPDSSILSVYLSQWPGATDEYIYNSQPDKFSVHVKQALSDNFYKCNYNWKNVRECAATTNPADIDACD